MDSINRCCRDLQCTWCNPMTEECQCQSRIRWAIWVDRKICARLQSMLLRCKNSLQQKIILLVQKKAKRRRISNRNQRKKVQRSLQLLNARKKSSIVVYCSFNITLKVQSSSHLQMIKMMHRLNQFLSLIRKKMMTLKKRTQQKLKRKELTKMVTKSTQVLLKSRMIPLLLMKEVKSSTMIMKALTKVTWQLSLIHMKMMSQWCSKLIPNPRQNVSKKWFLRKRNWKAHSYSFSSKLKISLLESS